MNKVFPISAEQARKISQSTDWLETSEAANVFKRIEAEARLCASNNFHDISTPFESTKEVIFWCLSIHAEEALLRLGYKVEMEHEYENGMKKFSVSWDVENEKPKQ